MHKYLDKCKAIIAEHGMLIQGVNGSVALCYTVGLSKIAGVELYMIGIPYENATAMLNSIRYQYLDGSVNLVDGEILSEVAQGFSLQLKSLGDEDEKPFFVAESLLGSMPKYLCVTYPDKNGVFPWEEGCAPSVAKIQSAEFLKTYL